MPDPWLADPDVTLYHGDALERLRELPDQSVHMVATSPPFYGLRDYQVEGQIGLEPSPDEWASNLVAVFRECRRVLRDDGTLWVEIGDSYNSRLGNWDSAQTGKETSKRKIGRNSWSGTWKGAKPKDLLGQPWLLAFALRADGWYLRSEIIWARPNPMPESVTDRPTKAHSTVFLFAKRARYFFDADAIREPHSPSTLERWNGVPDRKDGGSDYQALRPVMGKGETTMGANPAGANARSVWTIPTEPTPFAHFATWPQKLVARMVRAGTSERGCCSVCGVPWVRDVEKGEPVLNAWSAEGAGQYDINEGGMRRTSLEKGSTLKHTVPRDTVGWHPTCNCRLATALPVPCTVLDPFAGSGTTCLVARNLGRHAIGIELNPDYLAIASERLQQLSLLT